MSNRDRNDRHVGYDQTTRTMDTVSRGWLAHLGDLDDFKVADGEPDIRGWSVRTSDEREIGEVKDLLVDCGAVKVRYIEVELDGKALDLDEDRHVLVPIGAARLNDDDDVVVLGGQAAEMLGLPAYRRDAMSPERERALRDTYGVGGTADARAARADGDLYDGDRRFDDSAFFGARRGGRADAPYVMTRSEEELAIGTRPVEEGAVGVRKTVETEQVRRKVPVTHEEATVARRPISAEDAARGDRATINEREIRVPLMAEEVVTEKRVVPKEEVVIGKQAVTEQETVEDTVRKERVHVERDGSAGDHR